MFEEGQRYTVTIYVQADDGFEFAQNKWYENLAVATVNGEPASELAGGSDHKTEQTVRYTFTCGAAQGYSVSGTVWSEDAPAVPTVIQLYSGMLSEPDFEATAYGTTANFSIANVPSGNYTMKISKAGYVTQTLSVAVQGKDFTMSTSLDKPAEDHTHTFGAVQYYWSEDNLTCTAVRFCSGCDEREEEIATAQVEIITPATESTAGLKQYTATFANPLFVTQVKEAPYEYVAFIWGDANGDGVVDNKDIVRLKNYVANYDEGTGISTNGTTTYTLAPGADANGDGAVDNKDIVRLKNYVANYDEVSGISSNGTTVYILGPKS